MPIFTHNDADIWYTIESIAVPSVFTCLLLHGWTCDSHDWIFQIPMLLDHGFQVVALDHRGHGRSSAPGGSYAPQVLADDAAALLQHLNTGPAIVFGHSMGTTVASALAVRHPELVRALVLADPVYYRTGEMLKPYVATIKGPDAAAHANRYFESVFYTADTPAWMKAWHRRRTSGTPPHVIVGCVEGMYGDEHGIGRKEIAVEYFKSRIAPRLAVYRTEANTATDRELPLGELGEIVVLEGAGHWLHQQKWEVFNEIVLSWLNKVGMMPPNASAKAI